MTKKYMDYGSIKAPGDYDSFVNPIQVNKNKYGQVYYATHDGEGKSLSFMNKAFISFTYGGKRIEDFGLIATTVNDRLERETPPQHQDHITEYEMINGQYYWGSHYRARELSITLATDGITQQQLDEFKYWFQPGEIRELILSQHPNRGILARISEAPQVSVLPFKRLQYVIINGKEQEIFITQYKGNIQVNFVMDDPFWYAIHNVLGAITYDNNGHALFVDSWVNSNGEIVNILDGDAKQVMVEDHIPTSSMINTTVNFADGLKFQEYNQRKYTLDNQHNSEAVRNNYIGAPLANE